MGSSLWLGERRHKEKGKQLFAKQKTKPKNNRCTQAIGLSAYYYSRP